MKKLIILLLTLFSINTSAQTNNVVLIEVFTETGCGACAQNDSAFQSIVKENEGKVAVIAFHCYYSLDRFYQYNKACDQRYVYYGLKGYPSATVNGAKAGGTSEHLAYVTTPVIDKIYSKPKQFDISISTKGNMQGDKHTTEINVNTKSLNDFSEKDLRLFVAVTESNIDYEKRFKEKAVNEVKIFNNIFRTFLTDSLGKPMKNIHVNKENMEKFVLKSEDTGINYEEVRIVAFIQDINSKEILGAAVSRKNPFK
jgi:hypothetical protein